MSKHHPRPGVRACHYTTLGISMQPRAADSEGYLEYRDGFRDLPREEWTASEEVIARAEDGIEEFRDR